MRQPPGFKLEGRVPKSYYKTNHSSSIYQNIKPPRSRPVVYTSFLSKRFTSRKQIHTIRSYNHYTLFSLSFTKYAEELCCPRLQSRRQVFNSPKSVVISSWYPTTTAITATITTITIPTITITIPTVPSNFARTGNATAPVAMGPSGK